MDILKCVNCTTDRGELPTYSRTLIEEHRRTASLRQPRSRQNYENKIEIKVTRTKSVDRGTPSTPSIDLDDFDRFCKQAGCVLADVDNDHNNKTNYLNNVGEDTEAQTNAAPEFLKIKRTDVTRRPQPAGKKHSLTITQCTEFGDDSKENNVPRSLPCSPRSVENKVSPVFGFQTPTVNVNEYLSFADSVIQSSLKSDKSSSRQASPRSARQVSPRRSPERRSSITDKGYLSRPASPCNSKCASPTNSSAVRGGTRRGSRLWTQLRSILEQHHYIPINTQYSPGLLDPRTAQRGGRRSPERRSVSAPHSRSTSLKRPRRARTLYDSRTHSKSRSPTSHNPQGDPSPKLQRTRTCSLPTGDSLDFPRPDSFNLGDDLDPDEWQRIRRFVTTPKG